MDILQIRELKQSLERRDARILELERELEAARPHPATEAGEAVAWMCQHGGSCWFTQSEVRADMHRNAGWNVTPVYAHPPADAQRVAELDEPVANCDALADMPHEMLLALAIAQREELQEVHQQLTESREREGRMREALRGMLRTYNDAQCSELHHKKADQHANHEPCPVRARREAALDAAEAALAAEKE